MTVNSRAGFVNKPAVLVILSEAKDLCINLRSEMHRCFAALTMTIRKGSVSLQAASALLWLSLREIFDENAYARFLERNGADRSRESYERFMREMAGRRERRARCC